MQIRFTPDSSSDIGAGWERAWQAGRVDPAALTATDLRYGFFEYPVDFTVDGHAFLAAAHTPLVDLMFTVGHSLHGLRTEGAATIDFTENTYVIRLELVGDRVRFTASHDAPAPAPGCPLDTYVCEARRFVTDGVEYLERQHPALARNPAMAALRELAGVRATPDCPATPGAVPRSGPSPR
ncbi:hypothetical protein AB0N88_27015 [Streptomyces sp. NPDC093516]|uniref:hypothetical protein n=1 Tax=Streptomyces sp. NPDC093516 TaxID=3155304 RepID=UPI00341D80E8